MKYESLEIRESTVRAVEGGWMVTIALKNIGSLDTRITRLEVNNTVIGKYTGLTNAEDLLIPVNSEVNLWVKLVNPPFVRGNSAIIEFFTSEGNLYIQTVIIPEFGSGEEQT